MKLVGVDSGLCLQLGGSGYGDRDPAQLAECTDSERQNFRTSYKTGGQYQLVNVASRKCLDVDTGSMEPMASIIQWSCGDGANQQLLVQNRGSVAQLQVRHSGLCLDAKSAGKTAGTPIIQWPCSSALNQSFWLMPAATPTAPPISKPKPKPKPKKSKR